MVEGSGSGAFVGVLGRKCETQESLVGGGMGTACGRHQQDF